MAKFKKTVCPVRKVLVYLRVIYIYIYIYIHHIWIDPIQSHQKKTLNPRQIPLNPIKSREIPSSPWHLIKSPYGWWDLTIFSIFNPPFIQGLVNVLVEHHPNIGDIISNRYLKKLVMFKIPKMGHLPNPAIVLFVTLQNPPRRRDVLNTHAAQLGLHRFNILPWNSDPKNRGEWLFHLFRGSIS